MYAAFFDRREREEEEGLEWPASVLVELNPHVFHEISTSPALVSLVLRHFSDKLGELGEYDDAAAVTTIKLFKMAFGVVGLFAEANEPVFATHLGRLIMDSLPLAAKATHPMYYFPSHACSLQSNSGRYELLYKEVLFLLPEMLDSLNRSAPRGGCADVGPAGGALFDRSAASHASSSSLALLDAAVRFGVAWRTGTGVATTENT